MTRRRRVPRLFLAGAAALSLLLAVASCTAEPDAGWTRVDSWVTDLHSDQRLSPQPSLQWQPGRATGADAVVVDSTRRYQTMIGFGASMTDSSAALLSGLPTKTRQSIMADLFSTSDGIGLSVLRQPMGASEFAVGKAYSYDDQPAGKTDPDLSDFSIDHDRAQILPRLREAYRLNPRISFLASPWSAPGWMKDSDSLITGSLRPEYQETYARYFVEFVRAYRRAGIRTDYVSMQNEPLYEPEDYPGMGLFPAQEAEFVGRHLGPALRRAGLRTAILGYDHNWDIPDYPGALYRDRQAAESLIGTAWHCYAGEVSAQSLSHNDHPHAQAFGTECSGGAWQGPSDQAFALTMEKLIGGPRNWGQSVILWNLALDQHNGPHSGGCASCRGVLTVHTGTGTVTKNLDYWALGHASRFVAPGSVRIASSQPIGSTVANVVFRDQDGTLVMIAHNAGRQARTFQIGVGGRHVSAVLAAGAAATYRFRTPTVPVPSRELGWVDLDYGPGPAGTPGGRLVASVGPEVVDRLTQVWLDDRWLAYSLPYGAELRRSNAVVELDRTEWELSSQGGTPVENEPLANMLDGSLATRWSSGGAQRSGLSVTVDLGSVQTFTELSLDVGPSIGDYPRSYLVEVSADGRQWRSVARGPGRTGELIIALPHTTARYVRITCTASSVSGWSIAELRLRRADLLHLVEPLASTLIRDRGRLADGSPVAGFYNDSATTQTVPWPVPGYGYEYRLPPTAAATVVVLS